jgi:hypothetical protein
LVEAVNIGQKNIDKRGKKRKDKRRQKNYREEKKSKFDA